MLGLYRLSNITKHVYNIQHKAQQRPFIAPVDFKTRNRTYARLLDLLVIGFQLSWPKLRLARTGSSEKTPCKDSCGNHSKIADTMEESSWGRGAVIGLRRRKGSDGLKLRWLEGEGARPITFYFRAHRRRRQPQPWRVVS